jgi:peptide/nickel transport system substrate-binding protein
VRTVAGKNRKWTRRDLIKTGALVGGAVLAGIESKTSALRPAFAQPSSRSQHRTLVYLDSDTPASFDLDQTGIRLTEQLASACYGGDIVRYKVVRDPKTGALIADIFAPGGSGIDPGLAHRVDVSPDQRVYTFHLREDARSALGNPLTVDDVIWSFQRSIALKQTGAFFADVMGITKAKMEALNPHTLRITLPTRNPIFLRVDAMKYYGGLFDSKAAKARATSDDPWAKAYLATHTAGFDAYTVESYVKGQQVTLVANPYWYKGRPFFDRIVWKAVPESANRLSALLRGDADIAVNLTPPQLKQAEKAPGIKVTSYIANKIKSIQLNLRYKPLADRRVRQAIAYAIPYEEIIRSVYFGTARLVRSPIPETYPGYTPDYWEYSTNIDKARKLMRQAGQGPFEMTLTYNLANYDDPLLAPIIRSALKEIGISVTLNGVPDAVFVDKLYKHDGHAFLEDNWPFIAHPAYALWVYWNATTVLNIGGWVNAEFDALLPRMLVEVDEKRLAAMARRAQQIWEQEQPWILLANPGWHVAHRANITNLVWYPDNDVRFQELRAT